VSSEDGVRVAVGRAVMCRCGIETSGHFTLKL
jgi:hypothetical protein